MASVTKANRNSAAEESVGRSIYAKKMANPTPGTKMYEADMTRNVEEALMGVRGGKNTQMSFLIKIQLRYSGGHTTTSAAIQDRRPCPTVNTDAQELKWR
ncbi:hypothetical protein NDU88_005321 [Pleurodeles waltl]|uniref:Uncharacterized protein n=1 Tax=Pleurodeles waltl TaxID=8319 RepID=A0AAV7QEE6_PLEWA|nr:hypothetical protein NDU88_005321 [Pleurodeles waltl]